MFVEFSVANFRSIKERQTLSLVASKNKELQDTNTSLSANGKTRLLKTAIIYGANASGKSNLFHALKFFFAFACDSHSKKINEKIETEPFLFDVQVRSQRSEFEIIFYIDRVRYRYGYGADSTRMHYEYLFAVQNVQEVTLFTRLDQKITVNSKYFKEGVTRTEFARENVTFLSVCAQNNGELAKLIVSHFLKIRVTSGLRSNSWLTRKFIKVNENKKAVVNFLKLADFQLDDLRLETAIQDYSDIDDKDIQEFFLRKFGTPEKETVLFGHTIYDGEKEAGREFLKFEMESSSTQKLFEYVGPLIQTLGNGGTLFIDEFDAQLHPLIIEAIIKMFADPVANAKDAQLVVSCHAVNIMTNKLFRRDQIWFCEKDSHGATNLYSLVEFKDPDKKASVRNDASFGKNYLQGKYGAIPYLGEIFTQTECEV